VKKISALLAAAIAAGAGPAVAGEFVDTRLVFILGDDDFMHDAGTTVPPSPRLDIGDRPGYDQFYDKHESSERGTESRTHLVLHAGADGYFEGLSTDAALVLRFDHDRILSGDPRAIHDDGTYIRINQAIDEGGLEALLMPFSSDRIRLGYLWDISWGGDEMFPSASVVPGMRLRWDQPWYTLELGAKTARMTVITRGLTEKTGQIDAYYGLFGGFGVGRRNGGLRLDANGGWFQRGNNPLGDVQGEAVDAGGFSARLSYVDGLPFEPTVDTRIYTSDPLAPWNVEAWSHDGWRAAVEATYLTQVLADPDHTGGTKREPGLAAAGQMKWQSHETRVGVLGIYRDLAFLTFNDAGTLQRYQALPKGMDQSPELVGTLSIEHHLPDARLTPGLAVGVQFPASVSDAVPKAGNFAPAADKGRRTIIYRRSDIFDDRGLLIGGMLPPGEDPLPVFGGRASCELDLAAGFALIGEFTVLYDQDRTKLVQDVNQVNTLRKFDSPLTLGAAIMARAEL
jgi:hypothetical protein